VSGDRFGPGDAVMGKWQVTAGPNVVSPSFRLCAGGKDGCGATVWPEVVEESSGTYHASLYVRHPLFDFLLFYERKKEKKIAAENQVRGC
jgi:hypothetical protein